VIRYTLPIARLCSAMWIGAALLFVATSVTEQVHPSFDAETKNTLALVRFPWYYGMSFPLLLTAAVAALVAGWGRPKNTNAATVSALLLCFAQGVLWVDFSIVYRPLRDLLESSGPDRGAEFDRLHFWSESFNSAVFLLAAVAAVTLCATRIPESIQRGGEPVGRAAPG
jgi:hypothetical protein